MFIAGLAAKNISSAEFDQAMIVALHERFPVYNSCSITANVRLKPYQLPLLQRKSENLEVKVLLPVDKSVSGVMYVPVSIREQGHEVEQLRCRFDVKIFSEVYHPRRNFEKGERFVKEDFYLKPVNILNYRTMVADKNYNFEDKMIFSYLKADEPLLAWKMRKRPLVLVGQTVTASFVYDNIRVKSQAKVLQQGFRGEQIRVRVISSSKLFKAMVVDSDNVEVRL